MFVIFRHEEEKKHLITYEGCSGNNYFLADAGAVNLFGVFVTLQQLYSFQV